MHGGAREAGRCSAEVPRGILSAAQGPAAPASHEQRRHVLGPSQQPYLELTQMECPQCPSSANQMDQEHRHSGMCHRRGRATTGNHMGNPYGGHDSE